MEKVVQLVNTVGRDIKIHGVFRRTSTAETLRTVSDFILSYIDETTKEGVTEEGKKVRAYEDLTLGQAKTLTEGMDYLAKEKKGTLKPYGFLRDDIAKRFGKVPLHMTNRERIEAAHEVWMERSKQKTTKNFGHKFILSLDPRLCEIINESGKSVDEHLTQFVRTVMRRYQEKFYPNERIGYLMGIHHDRKHIHAHMLLYPTTESGKVLAVSDGSRRADLGAKRARPHKYMQRLANTLVEKFYEKEFIHPVRASLRPASEVTQKKLLTKVAQLNVEKDLPENTDPKTKWTKIIHERKRLESLSENDRRLALIQGYESELTRFNALTKTLSKKENAAAALEKLSNSMQGQKDALDKLTKKFKDLDTDKAKLLANRKKLMEDLTMWKKLKVLGRTMRTGTYGFNDSEAGRWFYERMKEDDEFGRLLRQPEMRGLIDKEKDEKDEKDIMKLWQTKADMDRAKALGSKHLKEVLAAGRVYKAAINSTFMKNREEDLVKAFLKQKYKEVNEDYNDIHASKKQVLNEMDHVRAKMQIVTLDKLAIKGAAVNRKPAYLQQYEGWKTTGAAIPVLVGGAGISASVLAQDKQREKVSSSFEEINERVQKILDRVDKSRGVLTTAVQLENEFDVTLENAKKITGLKKEVLAERFKELRSGQEAKALEVFFTPKKDTLVRRTRSSIDGSDKSAKDLEDRLQQDTEQ